MEKTDLERFIELYKSFGIKCNTFESKGQKLIALVQDDHMYSDKDYSESSKFEGYMNFHSVVKFDFNGKFISQGFWE